MYNNIYLVLIALRQSVIFFVLKYWKYDSNKTLIRTFIN